MQGLFMLGLFDLSHSRTVLRKWKNLVLSVAIKSVSSLLFYSSTIQTTAIHVKFVFFS